MRRIDGPGIMAEVPENPFDDRRRPDAGDDTQAAAALAAGLHVDGEHPLEALRRVIARCRSVADAQAFSPAATARVLPRFNYASGCVKRLGCSGFDLI